MCSISLANTCTCTRRYRCSKYTRYILLHLALQIPSISRIQAWIAKFNDNVLELFCINNRMFSNGLIDVVCSVICVKNMWTLTQHIRCKPNQLPGLVTCLFFMLDS